MHLKTSFANRWPFCLGFNQCVNPSQQLGAIWDTRGDCASGICWLYDIIVARMLSIGNITGLPIWRFLTSIRYYRSQDTFILVKVAHSHFRPHSWVAIQMGRSLHYFSSIIIWFTDYYRFAKGQWISWHHGKLASNAANVSISIQWRHHLNTCRRPFRIMSSDQRIVFKLIKRLVAKEWTSI